MWEIGSRGVVGLLSVFAGSAILYNAWGPILVLAILLFLVVNTCYSLLVNDSVVSPHNLLLFEYAKEAASELNVILEGVSGLLSRYVRDLADAAKRYYHQHFNSNMNRSRRSSYHLSSDSFMKARDSSSYTNANVNHLSPIPRTKFQQVDDWNEGRYAENESVKHTSTPLVPWRKENMQNGEPQYVSLQNSPSKISPLQGRNHTLSRGEETIFSPEGTPWGTSISPKMRAKAGGVKTVQTVAGPLLASTRYNIDTKVYSDVTSPGFTTRLSKYASDINNKLLHQSQYGMGHFPKVNLNASPPSLINTKAAKMRMPVTVRIAQPDAMRYSSSERHKMLNMVCHPENQSPNVVQALREISLKRHASREDVTSDLVKKQRTDGIYSDELENLEEMTQKRARDESSKSDDETSSSLISARPLKRSKGQSCNDILNSLSSSIHVLSGVKRKATDISRSSTPDLEKHFKSLDKYHNESFSTFPQENETPKSIQRFVSEPLPVINVPRTPEQKPQRQISPKGIFNTSVEERAVRNESKSPERWEIRRPPVMEKPKAPTSPVKLADKLFMRAEPQNNEKLRSLMEEQVNVKAKFSVDDKDEIKKKDIVNMRQTSMRARLQSMFDAISGKGANKINPDVVIQAEEVKDPVSTTISTALTTLNSSTTTTSVNTSPISSSVMPILKTNSNKKTPIKHVTFNLPSGESIITTSVSTENVSSKNEDARKSEAPTSVGFSLSTASATASAFSFGTQASTATSTTQESFNAATSVATFASKAPSASSTLTGTATAISTSFTSITPQSLNTTQSLNAAQKLITVPSLNTAQKSNAVPSLNTAQKLNAAPSLNTTQKSNTSPSLNAAHSLNTSVTTQSSGFTFGVIAKSPSSTPSSNFGQSPSIDSQKIIAVSLPSATISTPTFNLTTSTTTKTPSAAPVFSFGTSNPLTSTEQNTSKTQPPPAFGSVSSSFSFPANTTPVSNNSSLNKETTPSGFKPPVVSSTFSFGSAPSTKSGFSFGTSTTTISAPIFGASNSTPTFCTATSTTNPVTTATTFGASASTTPNFATSTSSFAAVNSSPLNFGASNTTGVKAFGTPATTASLFGTPATVTTATPFGSGSSQPIFGNSTSGTASAFGAPKTTGSIFGSTNTPTFGTVTSAPSLFSNSNVNATTSTTLPTFGVPVTTSSMFNQGNASVNSPLTAFGTSTTSSGLFSGATTNTTTTSTSTIGANSNIFIQSKPPPAFGATSSSFGNTGTSLFGASPTNSTEFNAISPATSATPAFGSSNSKPIFGAQNSGTAATVTQNSNFGFATTNSNTPSFGSTSTITDGFGSSSNNSFQAQNNNGIGFGAGNNNPLAFGSNSTTPFGSQGGSVFGTTNTPAPSFGAPVNNNNANNIANVGGSFTFGGNQTQTQPAPSFSFGGASTSNNSSNNNAAGAPFQFGSAASKPATGFNFNAPTSTPSINFGASAPPAFNAPAAGANNFAAPTGGMFSIGTGSTAPRSRTTRSRRQR